MVERLGRYVVLKHLASGGMADVLLARTDGIERFERHVVLKRIRAEHAKDQRFIDMFLDEARLAANLHHQNVVQVHDIGEADGEYFFAMEYLHGEDLRTLLSSISKTRTHMPLGHVIAIISAAAAGLHYAHERRDASKRPLNIVHRDVSPSNIFIGYDGSVKVVDFGIAKAAMRQGETRSGSLKGKVSYMSPEQCKLASIDRRSDIYSLGVVLYELATTTRLFKSDSDYLVMDAICTGKIPQPRVRRPDLPADLSTIIMKALATDPAARYQTAEELRTALDDFGVRHNLTASAGTLAAYVHKLFGEKPEPWLDGAEAAPPASVAGDTVASETADLGRRSWTELPRAGDADDAKTTTDGKGASHPVVDTAAVAGSKVDPPIERTSTRMGWEHAGHDPEAPARRFPVKKAALIAVPLVAVLGLGVWKLALSGRDDGAPRVVATASPATPVSPAIETSPTARPDIVASDANMIPPTPVAKPRDLGLAPRMPTGTKEKPLAPSKITTPTTPTTPTTKEPAAPATTKAPQPAPAPPAPPSRVEPAPPGPAPAVATPKVEPTPAPAKVEPAPAPVVAPAPAELPKLSTAMIEMVASSNRKGLSACEGTDELKGEVTVKFQVDAAGRVVKAQVSSTLGKPKVASCILRAIQGWTFPRPPTGAAQGLYTMSYQ